jgi:hypothetical protein
MPPRGKPHRVASSAQFLEELKIGYVEQADKGEWPVNDTDEGTTSPDTTVASSRKRASDDLGPGPLFLRLLRVSLVGSAVALRTYHRLSTRSSGRERDRDG